MCGHATASHGTSSRRHQRRRRHDQLYARSRMIAVTGEALIDLVVRHDGRADPRPGGGPFNAARTIGRLGLAPAFLGRLSQGSFGHLLRASLDKDGVTLAVPEL